MITTDYQVTGMSCGHCERAIRQEVELIDGITSIEVSSATGHLSVTSSRTEADLAALDTEVIAAVDEAGYEAVPR